MPSANQSTLVIKRRCHIKYKKKRENMFCFIDIIYLENSKIFFSNFILLQIHFVKCFFLYTKYTSSHRYLISNPSTVSF